MNIQVPTQSTFFRALVVCLVSFTSPAVSHVIVTAQADQTYGNKQVVSYDSNRNVPYGLNAASVSAAAGPPSRTGRLSTASAFASADLSTGLLRASTAGSYVPSALADFGSGYASATFSDVLTFNVTGATSTTRTDIDVIGHLDGNLSTILPYGDAYVTYGLCMSVTNIGNCYMNFGHTVTDSAQNGIVNKDTVNGSWTNFKIIRSTPNVLDYVGTFTIRGSRNPVLIQASLGVYSSAGASADFLNTASLRLLLPTGVSYTSASGVFLTQAVPEPASWMLMIAGFGMAGGALRRQQRGALAA